MLHVIQGGMARTPLRAIVAEAERLEAAGTFGEDRRQVRWHARHKDDAEMFRISGEDLLRRGAQLRQLVNDSRRAVPGRGPLCWQRQGELVRTIEALEHVIEKEAIWMMGLGLLFTEPERGV